ncbi:hypothetical protein KDN34_13690 [Shewanella yunxiaonensis]|uniref:Uncharacterized protein n=1 Tax=Shewanella yunxiaonensis TaxID=2829809 RepID=A0ABX7YSU2_9GAMM|nr:hypothetical protein [Shewanella yunxiaonensis]QUN05241.1 hypothetical protein KDN34_13690 [Shewanella yunxiaonensis]
MNKAINILVVLLAVLAGACLALSPIFSIARDSVLIGISPFVVCFIASFMYSLLLHRQLLNASVVPCIYTFRFGGAMGIGLVISQSISFGHGFTFSIYHLVALTASIMSFLLPKFVFRTVKLIRER